MVKIVLPHGHLVVATLCRKLSTTEVWHRECVAVIAGLEVGDLFVPEARILYTCICVYIYTCVCVCVYVCIYMYMYMYIYVNYMCI
jgi:hypothetical protein